MTTLPRPPEMYRALVDRNASYDGVFVVGVRTTGIFCRPTCPARKPRRENVEFFGTSREALLAGYRACRRCRPMDGGQTPPPWVQRLTAAVDRAPTERFTDRDLRAMAIDPTRARRYFKQRYGMTFHAYHRARRMGLAMAEIRTRPRDRRRGGDLTTLGLRHGYDSDSGFRAAFARVFGASPGRGETTRCLLATWLETPLGAMLAIAGDTGLHLLEFVDRRGLQSEIADLRRRQDAVIVPGDSELLRRLSEQLADYFAGVRRRFEIPLAPVGTPFQRAVWDRLGTIPYGETTSYAALATALGRPGAQRTVGSANGANRLAIVIPCHRVVRTDGRPGGYGGGLWRKQRLLELEGDGSGEGTKARRH